MAIYSANHRTIGRSTHEAGTAGAHVRYITRDGAARLVIGEHMPLDRSAAAWIGERETADRKNARVCDKVLVALPIEFDAGQRADLVREFMAEFGGGRVAWLAGIHDKGEDASNPHAHILIRDKDHETGKRVFGTSEKGSTERIRELWETVANRVLEREGFEARIDRRSLVEQGIGREAGIHVGPNVEAMEERGIRPESRPQLDGERVIDWPGIDQGRTRLDRQREIEAGNAEREQERSGQVGRQDVELDPVAEVTPEPEPRPVEQVQTWTVGYSVRLGSGATWGTSWSQDPVEMPRQRSQESQTVAAGRTVAEQQPEAIQRSSQKPQSGPELVPGQEAERSRLASVVAAARERLVHLGDRLESAFQAVRQRFEKPASGAPPRPEPEGAHSRERPMADDLRRLLDRYTAKNHAREPGGRD